MKKELKTLRIITIALMLIETISIVLLGLFYFFDIANAQEFLTNNVFYIILAVVAALDILYIWFAIIWFNKLRRKTNLKAADLIGADVQEAYNFGMIGLVIVDESNNVLWVNELFKDRQIDILDSNIFEWQPKLAELQTVANEATIKIEINSRNYEVKYLNDAGLYIFKDVTEYESIYRYSKNQALVIGIIMIDNYSDISGDAEDVNDVISKVKNAIFEYAKDFDVLLKKYRSDAYFMVCNYQSLSKMIDDKFSILEKVHAIGVNEDTPPTLSIGIGHDFPDVNKLNEMASEALDIAMSRGGDQVVISKYGEELSYFGGKTEALETRNKVKVRVMSESVFSLIKNSANCIILGHTMMDMDCLGSCLGMKAICDYYKKHAVFVYDSKLTEKKTRGAITSTFTREQLSKIAVSPSDAMSILKPNTLVIVVDVHRPSLTIAPKLLEKATKVIVIDHHRRGEEFIESPVYTYIDSSASSACELIAELIHYSPVNPKVHLPSDYATIMLSGIFMDSNFYKSKSCGFRTFEASMILKEYGADNSLADDFLKDEFEEYSLITKIISTQKTPYYGVVYCKADEDDIIEAATLAKVANQCMQMKGVNACFVIGYTGEKETRISCRSDGSINVQLLAEKMNGGGHFTSAAVAFKDSSIDTAETKLIEVLNEYLNDARIVKGV